MFHTTRDYQQKFIRHPVKHNETKKLMEGWKHKGNIIDPK